MTTRRPASVLRPALMFTICLLLLVSLARQAIADGSADAIIDERPLSARILGGGAAEPGDYPSIVALISRGFVPVADRLFCGGTVVAERWIMTAAHCVFDLFNQPMQPGFIRVVAGITDLQDAADAVELGVSRIIIHPEYDPALHLPPNDVAYIHDIALLELEAPVAAPIVTLFTGDTEQYAGALGTIAGWGAVDNSDPANLVYPTDLQDAMVPLVSHQICDAPQSYDGSLVASHLCAGFVDGKVDACAGDSGGPLFLTIEGQRVQAGITSFGIGCGLPLFYGIYTNVSHFIPWLSEYIPVPYQSPVLVAARLEQADQHGSAGTPGGGSTGWLALLGLLVITSTRRQPRR